MLKVWAEGRVVEGAPGLEEGAGEAFLQKRIHAGDSGKTCQDKRREFKRSYDFFRCEQSSRIQAIWDDVSEQFNQISNNGVITHFLLHKDFHIILFNSYTTLTYIVT